MESLPFSFTASLLEISSELDNLSDAIASSDRANIVRVCSCMLYTISDLLEQTLPDGVKITLK